LQITAVKGETDVKAPM